MADSDCTSITTRSIAVAQALLRTRSGGGLLKSAGLFCHRGASGFVQLALDKRTNEQVAIKFLERGGGASQRVIARELLNHRECALHPNIVQLKVPAAQT